MVTASSLNCRACDLASESSFVTCSESGLAAARAGDVTIIPAAAKASIAGINFSAFFIKLSFVQKLRNNNNVVDDAGHSGGGPGRALRFFPFEPGADVPVQRHRAVLRGNGDAARVDFRASTQRFLDFGFHLGGRGFGFYFNLVGDTADAAHPPGGSFGGVALIVPVGGAFERHEAVLN